MNKSAHRQAIRHGLIFSQRIFAVEELHPGNIAPHQMRLPQV
jgi:hypothetical protein